MTGAVTQRRHLWCDTPHAGLWAKSLAVTLILLTLVPDVAAGHVFAGNGGPGAGFMHPLTGGDHLLAMYAVGLLSAAIGGRAIWTVPLAFVLAMMGGGVLGLAHLPMPFAERGIALSVMLLGVALAMGSRLPTTYALVAAAVFGLCHGYAHGAEMPRVSSPALYGLGFVAATVGLHVLGVVSALLVQCRPGAAGRLRTCGVAIAAAGVLLVFRLR